MGKLLNCPFCGGEAEIAYSNDNHKQPYIRCKFGVMENPKCPASNMYQWQFHSLDEAIKAWNERKPMANIVEKLEYEKERHEKDREYWSEKSWKDGCVYNECDMSDRKCECFEEAINIVKQEINNGLE